MGSRLTALVVCGTALLSSSAVAFAQTAPAPNATPAPPSDPCGSILSIVNRPTIGTGVCTVRKGEFDIETGWQNTIVTGPGGGTVSTFGVSLIRFGTNDSHVDLEITPPLFNRATLGNAGVSGTSDSAFGIKDELGYNASASWGVNAQVVLPTGSGPFTAKGPQYVGNFNWSYSVNSVLGINGTLGFNELRAANPQGAFQSYFAFIPTFEATATLPGPSELFAEYAYFSQAGPGLGAKSEMDFGYIRDLNANVQFDVEYGITPTVIGGQRQHDVGAGLSFLQR